MYIIIHRATTMKTIQRDTIQNIINKLRWNPKKKRSSQRCQIIFDKDIKIIQQRKDKVLNKWYRSGWTSKGKKKKLIST